MGSIQTTTAASVSAVGKVQNTLREVSRRQAWMWFTSVAVAIVLTICIGIGRELPLAWEGKLTVNDWVAWLAQKNLDAQKRDGCRDDITPRVHLVRKRPAPVKQYSLLAWLIRLVPSGDFLFQRT
jgi:hypothetical protein